MPYGFNNDKSKFDLDALIGSVATIETSPATANHAVGEFIVYNSQLHEVTRAIASGENLVVGTNIEATSTGAEIANLKSDLGNLNTTVSGKMDTSRMHLTNSPKSGMASGYYLVFDLDASWASAQLWIQVTSGTNVYAYTQNTVVKLN